MSKQTMRPARRRAVGERVKRLPTGKGVVREYYRRDEVAAPAKEVVMEDEDMNMELTLKGFEQRMDDEEWADLVSEVLAMMSSADQQSIKAAAAHSSITPAEWYWEQLAHDCMHLWTEMQDLTE